MLLSNTAGVYLGDERWESLYEELGRRGTYVFVHPSPPPYPALPEAGSDPAPALARRTTEERAAIDHRNAAALVPRLARTPA